MKEKKPLNVEIGQNVKKLREEAGLTQERFAELIGLGVKHVSAIECGAVGVSLPTLQRICARLSVSADRVLSGGSQSQAGSRAAALGLLEERLSRLPEPQFWAVKEILDAVLAALELPQNQ